MSRAIKFRAWDKVTNQFIEGKFGAPLVIDMNGCLRVTEATPDDTRLLGVYRHDSSTYELMQYTGLKDKNGKECYEDDLIKIDDMVYRVEWTGAPNGAGFFLGMYKGSGMSALQMYRVPDGEIVGNVYEN